MDCFSQLPANVISQIVNYLPFKDRFRVGGVDKNFRKASSLILSETESINWETNCKDIFSKISPDSFSLFLQLCSNNLESAKFSFENRRRDPADDQLIILLIDRFSQLSFPRLIELDLGWASIGAEAFRDLMRKNANLKKFTWIWHSGLTTPNFPQDVVCEKLEIFYVNQSDDDFLKSFAGRCPNLKKFAPGIAPGISLKTIDDFVGTCPKLEMFGKRLAVNDTSSSSLTNFWRLKFLRDLEIFYTGDETTDNILIKIADRFPLLEHFEVAQFKGSVRGMEAIASLKNLQELRVTGPEAYEPAVERGIPLLVACPRLERIYIGGSDVEPETFENLLRSCPELHSVMFKKMKGIDTPAKAVEIVPRLGRACQKDITIHFCEERRIWSSAVVRAALKKSSEDSVGVITIEPPGDIQEIFASMGWLGIGAG